MEGSPLSLGATTQTDMHVGLCLCSCLVRCLVPCFAVTGCQVLTCHRSAGHTHSFLVCSHWHWTSRPFRNFLFQLAELFGLFWLLGTHLEKKRFNSNDPYKIMPSLSLLPFVSMWAFRNSGYDIFTSFIFFDHGPCTGNLGGMCTAGRDWVYHFKSWKLPTSAMLTRRCAR
jgi:hypothetical protein